MRRGQAKAIGWSIGSGTAMVVWILSPLLLWVAFGDEPVPWPLAWPQGAATLLIIALALGIATGYGAFRLGLRRVAQR